MLSYIDNYLVQFVENWGKIILPQLGSVVHFDITETLRNTKKSQMIRCSIEEGKRIYAIGFHNARGMVRKWKKDKNGKMVRSKGRGVVELNETTAVMAAIDINTPFITSDEVFLVDYKKDKPYNLEVELVEKAMKENAFDPKKDIYYIFFADPKEIEFVINRFVDDLWFVLTQEYQRAKGIIALPDAKWKKYHASDEITAYTNHLFYKSINISFSFR